MIGECEMIKRALILLHEGEMYAEKEEYCEAAHCYRQSLDHYRSLYEREKQRVDEAIRLIKAIANGQCSNSRVHAQAECKYFLRTHKGGE